MNGPRVYDTQNRKSIWMEYKLLKCIYNRIAFFDQTFQLIVVIITFFLNPSFFKLLKRFVEKSSESLKSLWFFFNNLQAMDN